MLSLPQCRSVWAAAHYSVVLGLPLNRFITIHWVKAQVEDVARALAVYLRRAGDWLRDRGVGLAYTWVHETTGGKHTHLLIHVPKIHGPAFGKAHRRWLKAVGAKPAKRAIVTRAVGASYAQAVSSPHYHLANLTTATNYILKEAEPAARDYAGRFSAKGRRSRPVVGKRCAASASVGPHARDRAGYIAPRPQCHPTRGWNR